MNVADRYDESITLPRAIRFPVELIPPDAFDPDSPPTWPKLDGRLEYVDGRLLYMPPCGDVQQDTVTDLIITLGAWVRGNPQFVLATNEAGMRLHGDTRAADAAIWRRADVGTYRGKLRRVPPVLAVEVAGEDEDETALRDKAQWYLSNGVEIVWLVLPDSRAVVVLDANGERRCRCGETCPAHPSLPGLAPRVDEFFVQIAHG